MSDAQPQSEAARRAAARKAKILARGNTGLAKLAQTARGEEAEALYGEDASKTTSAASSRPATPSATSTTAAPPPTSTFTGGTPRPGAPGNNMTAEQQAMSAQLEAMMSMFGGPPGGGGAGGEGMPDMSRLLAQMMGVDPSAGAGGQNLLGDVDDPAGLGPGPGAGGPQDPFAAFGGGAGAGSPFGGMPGLANMPAFPGMPGMGVSKARSKSEKYFPLVHFVSVVLLALSTVAVWEPAIRMRSRTALAALSGAAGLGLGDSWAARWAGYAGRRGWLAAKGAGVVGAVEAVPLFWAFTTLELILQTTRLTILKSPPRPHGLIANFLPLLPPRISGPLLTGSRYLSLLSQLWKDGCLLVFVIGMSVVMAEWLGVGVGVRV